MRTPLFLFFVFIMASGFKSCQHGASSVSVRDAAPEVQTYSTASQKQVFMELRQCGEKCSETSRYIEDYGKLRKKVRVSQPKR